MTDTHPVQVGAVIFEGFELLDLYGPLEMYGLWEGDAKLSLISENVGPLKSGVGPQSVAEAVLTDCKGFDILLSPGCNGFTRQIPCDDEQARYVTSSGISAGVDMSLAVIAKLFVRKLFEALFLISLAGLARVDSLFISSYIPKISI